MSTSRIFNRLALAASLALALFVSAFGPGALAQSAPTFRDVHVDVQPLRANAGDPTATWVQEDLTGQLAQALAGRMTRNGAPLTVRIDYLTLGPQTGEMLHAGASLDNILGVAVIGGQETPIRATTQLLQHPGRPDDDRAVKSRARVAAHAGADLLDRARRVLLTPRLPSWPGLSRPSPPRQRPAGYCASDGKVSKLRLFTVVALLAASRRALPRGCAGTSPAMTTSAPWRPKFESKVRSSAAGRSA